MNEPLSYQIDTRKLMGLFLWACSFLFFLFLATLGYFREVQLNEKLESELLKLQVDYRLHLEAPKPKIKPLELAAQPSLEVKPALGVTPTPKEKVAEAPLPPALEPKEKVTVAPKVKEPSISSTRQVAQAPVETFLKSDVQPKISQLGIQCIKGECMAKVSLVPSSPGTAMGNLVLVLETEVTRMGTVTHTDKVTKKFFVYPGSFTRDQLDPSEIASFEGKSFKFSSALRTFASFKIGNFHKPLALNAYLVDRNKQIIQHQRQMISVD